MRYHGYMNSRELWFKRKRYGWGWVPARWQGWAVLVVYAVAMVEIFKRVDRGSHSASDTLIVWVPEVLLLTLVLIAICYATGEKPRWQWGEHHAD